MRWTDEVADIIARDTPELWRHCYPKRILPPSGFPNPKEFSVAAWSHMKMWEEGSMRTDPHFMVIMSSLCLLHRYMPTYFVEPEFATAVAATRLPEGLKFSDLKWPLDSMLLAFHPEFSVPYFGYKTPFLAVSRIPEGTYPRSFHRPELAHLFVGRKELYCQSDRLTIAAHAYTSQEIAPTEYTACYPLSSDITVINDAPFNDATAVEELRFATRIQAKTTPEQDKALTNNLVNFAVKLLLVLSVAPRTVRTGDLARPEKIKGGKTREALWNPNMIGSAYKLSRSITTDSSGTTSPRFHLRWGHFTHQFIGKRAQSDFVSTSQLPRTTDGRIDWPKVPDEMRIRFWSSHKLIWIEPQIVNAQHT